MLMILCFFTCESNSDKLFVFFNTSNLHLKTQFNEQISSLCPSHKCTSTFRKQTEICLFTSY